MTWVTLYNEVFRAIREGRNEDAGRFAEELAAKMYDALEMRGWHRPPLTGDPEVDKKILALDRCLTGPRERTA